MLTRELRRKFAVRQTLIAIDARVSNVSNGIPPVRTLATMRPPCLSCHRPSGIPLPDPIAETDLPATICLLASTLYARIERNHSHRNRPEGSVAAPEINYPPKMHCFNDFR